MISLGADVTAYNNFAVRWASRNGHLKVVECLIEAGADARDKRDEAVWYAIVVGHIEVVKCLVKFGADVTARDDHPIERISTKRPEMVKYLVDLILNQMRKYTLLLILNKGVIHRDLVTSIIDKLAKYRKSYSYYQRFIKK